METSTPIPILLCGKLPGHILATTDIVKPEYRGKRAGPPPAPRGRSRLTSPGAQVLKACTTVDDARETVASLLSPATETPTIEGIEYPRPRLVVMGGGFTPADFAAVYESVDGAVSSPLSPTYRVPGNAREAPGRNPC